MFKKVFKNIIEFLRKKIKFVIFFFTKLYKLPIFYYKYWINSEKPIKVRKELWVELESKKINSRFFGDEKPFGFKNDLQTRWIYRKTVFEKTLHFFIGRWAKWAYHKVLNPTYKFFKTYIYNPISVPVRYIADFYIIYLNPYVLTFERLIIEHRLRIYLISALIIIYYCFNQFWLIFLIISPHSGMVIIGVVWVFFFIKQLWVNKQVGLILFMLVSFTLQFLFIICLEYYFIVKRQVGGDIIPKYAIFNYRITNTWGNLGWVCFFSIMVPYFLSAF